MRLAGQGSEEVQQVERPYTLQIYSLQIKLADQWNNASTGFEFDFFVQMDQVSMENNSWFLSFLIMQAINSLKFWKVMFAQKS